MSDYKIFIVGTSADYTKYLVTQEYNVLRADVLTTWEDANHVTRGHVLRTRISGSLRLVMRTADFETFLTDWGTAKNADGSHSIKVHVDNATTATEVTSADVFAKMSTKVLYAPVGYSYEPTAMEVDIEFEEA